jgi:hypothetical protein
LFPPNHGWSMMAPSILGLPLSNTPKPWVEHDGALDAKAAIVKHPQQHIWCTMLALELSPVSHVIVLGYPLVTREPFLFLAHTTSSRTRASPASTSSSSCCRHCYPCPRMCKPRSHKRVPPQTMGGA